MWNSSTCPIDDERRDWLEMGMSWLADQFGMERLRDQPVILPTDDYFPDRLDGSEAAAELCYELVCGYMNVESGSAKFEVFDDGGPPKIKEAMEWSHDGPAGLFKFGASPVIAIERQALTDPMAFVATVAHELGHLLLSGMDLDGIHEEDEEPLTDLLTVYFGLGIFGANASISYRQYENEVGYHGTAWSSLGYLDFPGWAYAHSLLPLGRGEAKPAWLKHLRPDVRTLCKQGMKYLRKTGNVAFSSG